MKTVKIVIGANFGDEGKGLMTDFFCSNIDKSVLNVRFNGTCQAGHTVVKDGRRHVFSHFGSGSFNKNVVTYLSSHFYANPILFNKEYDELVKLGINPIVKIAKNSPVVLIYDMIYNRTIESSRGNERHGSCGMGLWEALLRGRDNKKISVSDLQKGVNKLNKEIRDLRDGYFKDKMERENINLENIDDKDWFSDSLIDCYIAEAKKMLSRVELVNEYEVFDDYDYFVFEGAQGLLLDWLNRDYMPYLTASRTGLHNVADLLKYIDNPEIEVCYVTRSYFTKHGAGPFETEVSDRTVLGIQEDDKTNFENPWQGHFRYGYFDLKLFTKTINYDLFELYSYNYKKSICVTHMNETNDNILTSGGEMSFNNFKEYMNTSGNPRLLKIPNDDWNFYTSHIDGLVLRTDNN